MICGYIVITSASVKCNLPAQSSANCLWHSSPLLRTSEEEGDRNSHKTQDVNMCDVYDIRIMAYC